VLLLAGEGDPRLAAIRRTADQIPAATLAELPGCGHLDTFLRADLTLPHVLRFLSMKTDGRTLGRHVAEPIHNVGQDLLRTYVQASGQDLRQRLRAASAVSGGS
jgi:hypothetical protein